MAKRIIDWTNEGNQLVLREWVDGSENQGKALEWFEMDKIFPNFDTFNPVQKFVCFYGLKQKLADSGAMLKTAVEKAKAAREKFDDFVAGKLEAVRANASEAKADKALAASVKEAMKVVSLESLILKKALRPEQFTDEDQVKLDEFLALKVSMEAKKAGKK